MVMMEILYHRRKFMLLYDKATWLHDAIPGNNLREKVNHKEIEYF
jgi:hypothetical protein